MIEKPPIYPVFIVGSPRSGTSILVDCLKGAGYTGFSEGNFLTILRTIERTIDKHFATFDASDKRVLISNIDREALKRSITECICRYADSSYEVNESWIDKSGNPEMIEAIPLLQRYWPNSRFIFAKRRGIENVVSRLKKFPAMSFQYHCMDWAQNMRAWREFRATQPKAPYIEIDQYEISRSPRNVASRIGRFLDLGQIAQDHIADILESGRPQQTEAGSAHRVITLDETGWDDQQKQIFRDQCGGEMAAFGYTFDHRYSSLSVEDMKPPDIRKERFITGLYEHLLQRSPNAKEQDYWVSCLGDGLSPEEAFERFVRSQEYATKHSCKPGHPLGHFYSPVVDTEAARVRDYWNRSSRTNNIPGLKIDLSYMEEIWYSALASIRGINFCKEAGGKTRYFHSDRRYPLGDAIVLTAIMSHFKPRKVIEVGSGFSSAALLDIADYEDFSDFHLTCIDPDAARLRSLLRSSDLDRLRIIEKDVQAVPTELFDELGRRDLLLIDSSHVLKTGSDVHFILFEILPRLKPGVLIHFHDIHFPFEYPSQWIFVNKWSWNEVYAVRAFLMYNSSYKLVFFSDFFFKERKRLVEDTFGETIFGGSLWIERHGDS